MYGKTLLRVLLPVFPLAALGGVCLWEVNGIASRSQGYGDRTVVINEICAHNLSGLQDGDGNCGDWIELYNPRGGTIDLSGWTLTDDKDDPDRWTFPEGTVLGEYLVLFADGTDTVDGAGYLHTAFALRTRGETLYLYDADGELVDRLKYPEQDFDITYGRAFGNGEDKGTFATATPGAANPAYFLDENREGALGTAEFSLPSGFYDEPVEVALSAEDPDALIFYTTDGSDPAENGTLYTGPIQVKSREGEKNEYVSQITGFLEDHVNYIPNYAYRCTPDPVDKATTITTRIYKEGRWSDEMVASTYWIEIPQPSFPVVSVTTDADSLFGKEGIYVPGVTYFTFARNGYEALEGNFLSDEKVSANVQILDPALEGNLQGTASISLGGQFSRAISQMKNIYVDMEDGTTTDILVNGIRSTNLDEFALKGPGNGIWQNFYQNAFWNNYLYELYEKGLGSQYNIPVILYLEDEYWGIYMLSERKNENFIARHFEIDLNSLQTYSLITYKTEEIEALETKLYNLPYGEASWEWLNETFDIESFIYYATAHLYANNLDGLAGAGNNMTLWKAEEGSSDKYADGKWRFLLYDFDQTLLYPFMDSFEDILNAEPSPQNIQQVLFQKLWEYPEFRTRFAEIFTQEMQNTYAADRIGQAFASWCEMLEPEMENNLNRQTIEETPLAPFAEKLTGKEVFTKNMSMEDWNAECQEAQSFFDQRAEYLLDYLKVHLQ